MYVLIQKTTRIDAIIKTLLIMESGFKVLWCVTNATKIGHFSCLGYSDAFIYFANAMYNTGDETASCWFLAALTHYASFSTALCICISGLIRYVTHIAFMIYSKHSLIISG